MILMMMETCSQRGDKGRNGILRFAPADALLNDLGSVEHGYVI